MNNLLNPSQEFAPGQIVFLKADPSTRGAVVAILPGTPENRINVFVDGNVHTFYPSQLQLEVQDDSRVFSCDDFHAYLTALQIRYPDYQPYIRSTQRGLTLSHINTAPF